MKRDKVDLTAIKPRIDFTTSVVLRIFKHSPQ